MRANLLLSLLAMSAMLTLTGCPDEINSRRLGVHGMKQEVVSPEGWSGMMFFDNDILMSEEYAAFNKQKRHDLWRYYENGKKILEEWDRNQDNLIDLSMRFEPSTGVMTKIVRDTRLNRVHDITIEYIARHVWKETVCSKSSDQPDYVLICKGPANLLTSLAAKTPLSFPTLRQTVPTGSWIEMDESVGGRRIDKWTRYEKGRPAASGSAPDSTGKQFWTPADPTEAAKIKNAPVRTDYSSAGSDDYSKYDEPAPVARPVRASTVYAPAVPNAAKRANQQQANEYTEEVPPTENDQPATEAYGDEEEELGISDAPAAAQPVAKPKSNAAATPRTTSSGSVWPKK